MGYDDAFYKDETNRNKIVKRQTVYNKENKVQIAEKQAVYNKKNKVQIAEKQAVNDKKNRVQKAEKQAEYDRKEENKENKAKKYKDDKLKKQDCSEHRKDFENEIKWGPIFPCVSCKRDMFIRGVQEIKDKFLEFLDENNLDQYVDLSVDVNGKTYICHNCKKYLSKKDMPPLINM